jgi:hypothetical protein
MHRPRSYYTTEYKHSVLLYYKQQKPRISFRALSRHFKIIGGHPLVRSWYKQWNGTSASLEPKPKHGRPRALSTVEANKYIGNAIRYSNRNSTPIHYSQIYINIKNNTRKNISLSSVRRYGKALGAHQSTTIKRTSRERKHIIYLSNTHLFLFFYSQHFIESLMCFILSFFFFERVSKNFCDQVKRFRVWAKRIDKKHMLFLDESYLRVGETSGTTLVVAGEQPIVEVSDNTSYAHRYDMIACCTGSEVLPPVIYTPQDRARRGVKGITSAMVVEYIDNILAQAVRALDRYPMYLVCDNSSAHNKQAMLDAFRDRGCGELVDIVFMPAMGAKRLSPLDNGIFGLWKQKCRQHTLITSNNILHVMTSTWNNISPRHLMSCYQHCALTYNRDYHFDCPAPSLHRHKK